MDNTESNSKRAAIKSALEQLPDHWQLMFKKIYSKYLDIDTIVDNIPSDKLDRLLTQVNNSLSELNESSPEMGTNELVYYLNYRCVNCGKEYGIYPDEGCPCCGRREFTNKTDVGRLLSDLKNKRNLQPPCPNYN